MADVDLKCGRLKDQLGQHGHETIEVHLYVENDNGAVNFLFGFRYISIQGLIPEGNENLQAIQFSSHTHLVRCHQNYFKFRMLHEDADLAIA